MSKYKIVEELQSNLILLREKLKKASDPNTHPSVLDELADNSDNLVKEKIANNPNADLNTLFRLHMNGIAIHNNPAISDLVKIPDDIQNPLIHPWLLQDADHDFHSLKKQNFLHFVSHPNTNVNFLRILAKHPDKSVVASILKNPNVTSEFLFGLADHKEPYVRVLVTKHSKTGPQLLSKIGKSVLKVDNAPEKKFIASNKNTPVEMLSQLALDQSVFVRRLVALNKNTDKKVLHNLAFDPSVLVRGAVIDNPNIELNTLIRMASDESVKVRKKLAKKENMHGRILEHLSKDNVAAVRKFVALNPKTPAIVLDRLAGDIDTTVREAVLKNEYAPESAIEKVNMYRHHMTVV